MLPLERHAIVTGAAGGLGRALCFELAESSHRVSALDIDEGALAELEAADPSGRIRGACVDITDGEACREAIGRLRDRHGPVDLLVNNAGITHFSTVADVRPETIEQVMAVNFMGAVHCTQAVLPDLVARRGQVVVLSSVAGFAPLHGRCAYSASKHALHGFFDTLRGEVRDQGVAVLIVCPSFIDTQRDHRDAASPYEGASRPGSAKATVGDVMQPEVAARQIARAIAKRSDRLLVGRVAKQSYWIGRLFPRLYETLMVRRARREVSG